MAYDKIIVIRSRLDRCLAYVCNSEKTALNGTRLVTAINCSEKNALDEMKATKARWNKTDGVQGYHVIHSYAPGEVSPEDAHRLGVELAERLFGDRYEVVVATHTDHSHLHCHIVFNSVSQQDGRRYRNSFKDYFGDIQETSNALSRENKFSVIEPKGHGKHYAEWNAAQQGQPTVRGVIRRDIDMALAQSVSLKSLFAALEKQGYAIKNGSNIKYPAVRPPGSTRFFRLESLGPGYTPEELAARLRTSSDSSPVIPALRQQKPGHYRLVQQPSVHPRPLRGYRALYVRYLYLLGIRKPVQKHKPIPFDIRAEVARLEQYKRQFCLLQKYHVETDIQLDMLHSALQADIDSLKTQRAKLYRMKQNGVDASAQLYKIRQQLSPIREELRMCRQIEQSIPHIQSQLEQYRQTPELPIEKSKQPKRRHDLWK